MFIFCNKLFFHDRNNFSKKHNTFVTTLIYLKHHIFISLVIIQYYCTHRASYLVCWSNFTTHAIWMNTEMNNCISCQHSSFVIAARLHAQDVIYTQVAQYVFLRFEYTLENVSRLNQTCGFQCQIFCASQLNMKLYGTSKRGWSVCVLLFSCSETK